MLESFKVKQAWTFLFKEKSKWMKLLIPFVPTIIAGIIAAPIFIIATLIVFRADSQPAPEFFQAAGVFGSLLLLCLCCVGFIYAIIQAVITSWYQYEYTRVGMQGGESDVITQVNKMEVVKKAGKLILVNLIYNIPTGIILGFFYFLLILSGGVRQTYYATGLRATSATPTTLGLLLLCIIMFLVIFVVIPFNFYIVQTAKVRLIQTNTFREAFRIRTIFALAKKNFKRLSMFLGILALYVIGYMILSFIVSIFAIIPFVGLCLIPVQIILALATWYFGVFAYPYMMGAVYKEVK